MYGDEDEDDDDEDDDDDDDDDDDYGQYAQVHRRWFPWKQTFYIIQLMLSLEIAELVEM